MHRTYFASAGERRGPLARYEGPELEPSSIDAAACAR